MFSQYFINLQKDTKISRYVEQINSMHKDNSFKDFYKLNKSLFKQKHKNSRVVVHLRYIFLLSNLVFDYNP